MAKIEYDTLPPESIVDIQISGVFYKGLVDLLTALGESVPIEDFKKVLEKLKTNEPAEDIFEMNVRILMSLIYEIESKAKAQNKTKKANIEVPDEAPTTDS